MSTFRAMKWVLLSMFLWGICDAMGQSRFEERPEFGEYFTEHGVSGSFLLYDMKQDMYLAYDPSRCKRRFVPASTFKIFNSLVALETGVAPDEHFALKWDSVDHGRPAWNQDQDMGTALRNSTVWFYQEIARRVGEKRMKEWISKEHYGNMDISGGIDQFWLQGGLKISQEEQIDFLRRLYSGTLGFSQHSTDIVRRMLIVKDTSTYTLRAKTGWYQNDEGNIGWFVGYLEQGGNVYFYATTLEASGPAPEGFASARRQITEQILRRLGLLS